MSESSRQNPALRAIGALKDVIGRRALSTTEFAAVPQSKVPGKRRAAQDEPLPKIPRITYGFGAGLGPSIPSTYRVGPSRDELVNEPLVEQAMSLPEPAADDAPPPLYSPRARR